MELMQVLCAVVMAAACTVAALRFLYMFQLESYQLPGYRRYLSTHKNAFWGRQFFVGLACAGAQLLVTALCTAFVRGELPGRIGQAAGMALACAGTVWLEASRRKMKEKKPFVCTKRMQRLIAATGLISCLLSALWSLTPVPVFLLLCFVPLLPVLAGACMQPVEKAINMHYFRDAQSILSGRPELIKIGITGSYGKTSTKFVLSTILAEKYIVLASPASYNTPMGLTRVIREMLEPQHQVFIAEMGARHKGDIAELIDLVHPTYGLLTSVGPQHLETFGDMETIARAKFELIEGIEQVQGSAFFVSDEGIVDKLYEKASCDKRLVCAAEAPNPCYATQIECTPSGSRFTLVLSGREIPLTTRLLGMHNIRNICLACACAEKLGLTDSQIARGVAKLRPVEHRLQLLPNPGGVLVIDDAFNANAVGAAEALRVLHAFPGRHIVVTPGMVEGGAMETALNTELGRQIAATCDFAILVGRKHAEPIAQGARSAGMPDTCIHLVSSLAEAQALLATLARPGDTVLFENDLPDNYHE